jgi:succinate dehydrogenase / fumarate reductase flavoprotein subunit
VPDGASEINFELEKAARVADYLEMAVLIVEDALQREESCGAHFREEHQTEDGEALRNDQDFRYVSVWEYLGENQYNLHKEVLDFEFVELKERSYK